MQERNKLFLRIVVSGCVAAAILLVVSEIKKGEKYSYWKIYENGQWKVQFRYPPEAEIDEISQNTVKLTDGNIISFKQNTDNFSLSQLCEKKEYTLNLINTRFINWNKACVIEKPTMGGSEQVVYFLKNGNIYSIHGFKRDGESDYSSKGVLDTIKFFVN